jgi:hypothetical protein
MTTPASPRALVAIIAVATLFLLLHAREGATQRVGRRGGEVGGEAPQRRSGEEGAAGREGYDERGQGWRGENGEANGQWQQGGGDADAYTTRRGGTVDTDKTTDGDTTTRDTTWTGEDGQSADHTGSVTKDDGSYDYSGSSSGGRGSSDATVNGTYSDGKADSAHTSVTGTDAAGETGTHDGNWNRDGDTVTYHGDSSTSTGRDSAAAGAVTRTDDGFVARGAAVGDRGVAAGTVVKDGDQVYGRSVTTNGESVNRNATDCNGGDCNRVTTTTEAAPYGAAVPYFVPYSSYPCPSGVDMVPSASGDIVYSCAVTPVVTTTIPLTAAVATANGAAAPPASAQVTSSAVVMYQVSPDTVVYATSYAPQGLYAQEVNGRYYWVPGVAAASAEVTDAINAAENMEQPTANATVITYAIGSDLIYLTGQPPARGIYAQSGSSLYAWVPGVTQPTEIQRDAVGTSLTVHGQQGARALADAVRRR